MTATGWAASCGAAAPVKQAEMEKTGMTSVRLQNILDELHRQAALLYARCRWQGVTVRSPMDCVVAACALEAKMPLLACDRDFAEICRIEPKLQLIS